MIELWADIEMAYAASREVRRHVHAHPELSGQEWNTSEFLRRRLEELGIKTHRVGDTPSFWAYCAGRSPEAIALRVELDALPVCEATGLAFESQTPGVMHACGHDVHMAVGYGAALLWQRLNMQHSLLLLFESSEEKLPGGALDLLESGVLAKHSAQWGLAFHCDPSLEVGELGFCPDAFMASGDEVYITVRGRGGHGALPHLLVDPVLTAAHVVVGLQAVHSRYAPASVSGVLSIGHVECRGATNLIPNEVRLEGTLRTHSEPWRATAKEHIRRIATSTASAYGAEAEVRIVDGYPVLRNDASFLERIRCAVEGASAAVCVDVPQRMTCDDFSYVAERLPSAYLRLGVGATGGLHTETFSPSEGAMSVALKAMVAVGNGSLLPDGREHV